MIVRTTFIFVTFLLTTLTWAQNISVSNDANDSTKERYCDPIKNADILTKIKIYEDQIASLPKNDPKAMSIMTEISKLTLKFQCGYRVKK